MRCWQPIARQLAGYSLAVFPHAREQAIKVSLVKIEFLLSLVTLYVGIIATKCGS